MAYNSDKGPQHSGDIQYEGDPNDVQIDFENDQIILRTGGAPRVSVTNAEFSGSGVIRVVGSISGSGDLAVTGAAHAASFHGAGAGLTGLTAGGSATGQIQYRSAGGSFDAGSNLVFETGIPGPDVLTIVGATTGSSGLKILNGGIQIEGAGNLGIGLDVVGTTNLNAGGIAAAGAIDGVTTVTSTGLFSSSAGTMIMGAGEFGSNIFVTGTVSTTDFSGSGIIQSVGSISSSGDLAVTGAAHAASFHGDGAGLTGLAAGSGTGQVQYRSAGGSFDAGSNLVFETGIPGPDVLTIVGATTGSSGLKILNGGIQIEGAGNLGIGLDVVGTTNLNAGGIAAAGAIDGVTTVTSTGLFSSSAGTMIMGAGEFGSNIFVTGTVSTTDFSGSGIIQSVGSISSSADLALTGALHVGTSAHIASDIDIGGDMTAATITMTGFGVDSDGDTGVKTLYVDNGSTVGCASDRDMLTFNGNAVPKSLDVASDVLLKLSSLSGSGIIQSVGSISSSGDLAITGTVHADTIYSDQGLVVRPGTNFATFIDGTRISSSVGAEVVGSSVFGGTLGISGNVNIGGPNLANSALYVKTAVDNATVALFKSPSNDTIMALSGSGKIAVGGLYLDSKFNITGSDSEALFSAKSDSIDPVIAVSGSGLVTVSGSLRAKQIHMTEHKFNPGDTTPRYVRFGQTGGDTSPGGNNKMAAPFSGKLVQVIARATGTGGPPATPPNSTAISLHTNVDGNENISTTATETITVNMSTANTTYAFTFTNAANYGPGDIVGLKFAPTDDPGTVILTAVWEFDQNSPIV